jgi:hypothetical protein
MEILEKRLNDKGKNWRHVYKSLTVLEYLLYHGSDMVVKYTQDNIYLIKTLKDFQYRDENNQDEGINVRVKSKEIYDLITDETKLLNERSRLKTGMTKSLTSDAPKNLNDYDEDLEIRKAIENSKETLIQDEKRREMKRSQENLLTTEKNDREKGKSSKSTEKGKSVDKDLLILDEPIPDEIQPKNNNLQYQQMQYQQIQQQFQGMDFFGNNNNTNMLMSQNQNNMQLNGGNMMNSMLMNNNNNNNLLIGNNNMLMSINNIGGNNNNLLMNNNSNLGGNNNLLMSNNNNLIGNNNNLLMNNNNNNNLGGNIIQTIIIPIIIIANIVLIL